MVAELTPTGTRAAAFTRQADTAFRFDWGLEGLRALASDVAVVIVVDVLRFSTAVAAALESGAVVYPYPWADDGGAAFAAERGAVLAGRRELGEPSLSPADLLHLAAGTRLVLPSPNGSALCVEAARSGARIVMAGCLRNATAVARTASHLAAGGPIAVIAAGERWHHADGPLRPAVEDALGAGAILAALDPSASMSPPRCSPEAAAVRASFVAARPRLVDMLRDCASGRELVERGWDDDVDTSAAYDVSDVVPVLDPVSGVFRDRSVTRRGADRSV